MLVCTDTEPDTDPAPEPDIDGWVAENDAAGRRVFGDAPAPVSAATTVRVRNGEQRPARGFRDGPLGRAPSYR